MFYNTITGLPVVSPGNCVPYPESTLLHWELLPLPSCSKRIPRLRCGVGFQLVPLAQNIRCLEITKVPSPKKHLVEWLVGFFAGLIMDRCFLRVVADRFWLEGSNL